MLDLLPTPPNSSSSSSTIRSKKVKKPIVEPTVSQMKAYRKSHTDEEWRWLTSNQQFLDLFAFNLTAADIVAKKILGKK